MGTAAAAHLPVMRDRVLELLAPALEPPGAVLVDATLGRAGHASALLAAHPGLSLIGIDTDATAIEESRQALAGFGDRVTLVQAVLRPAAARSWPAPVSASSRACCSTWGFRRRSWMIRAAGSPTPWTHRSTCG